MELFLLVIYGSIPTLKPIYDKLVKGKPLLPTQVIQAQNKNDVVMHPHAIPLAFSSDRTVTQVISVGDDPAALEANDIKGHTHFDLDRHTSSDVDR